MGFVDAQGRQIRYTDYYSNAVHGLREYMPPPAGLTPNDGTFGGAIVVNEVELAK